MTVTRAGQTLYLMGGCVKDQPFNTNCQEITATVDAFEPDPLSSTPSYSPSHPSFCPLTFSLPFPFLRLRLHPYLIFRLLSSATSSLGTFRSVAPMPRPRFRHTASVVNDSIIVVIGGRNVMDELLPQVDIFRPFLNSW